MLQSASLEQHPRRQGQMNWATAADCLLPASLLSISSACLPGVAARRHTLQRHACMHAHIHTGRHSPQRYHMLRAQMSSSPSLNPTSSIIENQ
jgi:hypothetical protein